jgi:hydrogenase expression/formation protein HypC
MCIGIPMRIIEIKGNWGTVELDGVRKEVSLFLLDQVEVGDYVIVHAGFAIHKIDAAEAEETLALIREIAERIESN